MLVGDAPMSAAVRETTVPGLSVLVAGRIPPNPTELLGAPRFRELMTTVRTHFDWIIVDTPPVMAVADATLVAHLATGVVFVVGAEMTSRHAAKRALDQLEHVHAKFVGGVLNKVDLQRNPYLLLSVLSPRVRAVLRQGVVSHREPTAPARSTRNVDARHQCSSGRADAEADDGPGRCREHAPHPVLRPSLRLSQSGPSAGSHGALLQ